MVIEDDFLGGRLRLGHGGLGGFFAEVIRHPLGQGVPLRCRLPELMRKGIGQRLKSLGDVQRPVKVKQHHPRLGRVVAAAARLQQTDQTAFALLEVGIGKGDHGLIQVRVKDDFAHIHGQGVG